MRTLQQRLGEALFLRVAGPSGPSTRQRFHSTPGPRWFAPDRPIRRVHGDAAMFVGGLRALLLQSLHPVAMTAIAQHSDYRADPWGRLQRTSTFLAATTFGAEEDAQRAVDRVRGIHARVNGTGPDGRPYRADDPHLLRWVHITEADSFLRCHQRYGERPLDEAGCDGYVSDIARVATALGVPDPPRTRAELSAALREYEPEIRAIPEALEAARFLISDPPLPLAARGPYAALAAAAIADLPGWARRELRLPWLPLAGPVLAPAAGHAIVRTIRWAMRGLVTGQRPVTRMTGNAMRKFAAHREAGAGFPVRPVVSITTDDRSTDMANPVVHFEIRSADPDATRKFFGQLFGWTFPDGGMPGYTYVDTGVEGAVPGGISPLQGGAPLVTFFVGVPDVAATLEAAVAQGGRVIQPATSVPGVTFGLVADPQGQVVGLAQAHG